VEAVAAVAKARGLPRAQVALAWVLAKPMVSSPIIGATKPAQLDDAFAALSITLSGDEIAALEAPYVPHGIVGFQ
jgi:1-deoxyxylulose-5-phosphate synthase